MDNVYEGVAKAVIERIIEPAIKKLSIEVIYDWEKIKIDYNFTFTNYLKNTYEKYSKIKTILGLFCLKITAYLISAQLENGQALTPVL